MDLTPYVVAVEDSLAAASAAGDDETRRIAGALTAALEPATRLAILDALSEFALEVGEALGDRTVDLRLESGQVGVAVGPSAPHDTGAAAPPVEVEGEPSRITLRLPDSLKAGAEHAAAAAGISLNAWLVRAVQESLRDRGHRPTPGRGDGTGHRVRGWVQG